MQRPNPDAAPEDAEIDALEALEARGDVGALLEQARAARAAKDMNRSLACYEAAARLGSPEAHYAAALFVLSGPSPKLADGAAHLRAAAEGGILQAKIYIGNLYELGVHYTADVEKADVWYRSAARQAGVTEEIDTIEYMRRMADLGCVRAYLELAADEGTTEDQRAAWSKKARTLGYQLKVRAPSAPSTPSNPDPVIAAKAPSAPGATTEGPQAASRKAVTMKMQRPRASWITPVAGARAFVTELLFLGAALATGFLASEGAKVLMSEHGKALPIIGTHFERTYFIALALIGVLPALLVYRARTVAAALGASFVAGAIGFVLHGSPKGTFIEPRVLQISAFALAAYAGTLLVLGNLGGAKSPKGGR